MRWVAEDPARFNREQEELARLQSEVGWLAHAWQIDSDLLLCVDIDMTIHGRVYEGRLIYPLEFPNAPPYIKPRNPDERWTGHQYGNGGSLCLKWRPENWQTHITGAEQVRDAFDLISTEKAPEPGIVPSDHYLTEGQELRSQFNRLLLTKHTTEVLSALPKNSANAFKLRRMIRTSAQTAFFDEITPLDTAPVLIGDTPPILRNFVPLAYDEVAGSIFRSNCLAPDIAIPNIQALLDVLKNAGFQTDTLLTVNDESYAPCRIAVLGEEIGSLRVFGLIGEVASPYFYEYKVLPSSDASRLPAGDTALTALKFCIVGLGSVGSKVAASLTRSGVKKLLLIDDDILKIGNLCRHDLSWMSVGLHKVHAVKEALELLSPGIEVEVKSHRFSGQESPVNAAGVLNDIAQCDVIVDASANPEVFLRLAGVAKRHKKAMCWAELFAGGFGGLIARARPEHDPNPLAVRDSINAFLAAQPPAPFKHAANYDDVGEVPLLAFDCDVGLIAATLTQLVLDTALKSNPARFPHSAYLIGMGQEWFFEQPFDTRPIEVSGQGWESDAAPVSDEERMAALTKVVELIGSGDADSDRPT